MARIQTPQHVQELQAEFKVRQPFGLELLESIQPTYSLGRQKIASTGYPRNVIGFSSASAGGVGTNIECAVTCPADRGIVILLDEIWIEDITGKVTFRITDGVALATVSSEPITKAFRDGRLEGQIPDGILSIANPLSAAPNGAVVSQISIPADDTRIFKPDIILGGGAYFLVRQNTANVGMAITFMWTEFLLEDR